MLNHCEMDNSVPGGVYLCQINERVSCGACCGLYNVADVSSEGLTEILIRRTEAFERISRDVNSVLDFKKATDDGEPLAIPFPDFHHCPYLGLVGERHSRVGCLLHSQANGNNGVDFRGLSYYGGMACSIYFCPSYSQQFLRIYGQDGQKLESIPPTVISSGGLFNICPPLAPRKLLI